MGVEFENEAILKFEDWYKERQVNVRDGALEHRGISKSATELTRRYEDYKREMDSRCHSFEKLERIADNEVVSEKPDLPNVSSGETAGLIRRMARNLVQNTPNVEVISKFDDDSLEGVLARHALTAKIIGSDLYSNDMQQNLFASTRTALTIGFDCVIPVLLQKPDRSWFIKYDTIHYRDVFPEPGAKDVREATEVFVRRYLTKGEVASLIRNQVTGWDQAALLRLLRDMPVVPNRDMQSQNQSDKKKGAIAQGYEVVTWYSTSGRPFLTFVPRLDLLLRIEKNLHPNKEHPVHFLVLEKDHQHPLGKSQVELLFGRQEFQDLMHNGAMKLWYRNINPSIIGYGAVNAVPNLSPGKYTQISNPNAKIEAFEVNTQTLMQYQTISQGNLGAMVNLVGSADQQMAVQAGNGMSATPQGVDAQTALVDITTNNYQKAIERFFSHYCSYALTIYFQELKAAKVLVPNAEARHSLINAGLPEDMINEQGEIHFDFSKLAVEYFVRCVPGSLVELEDEKQLRILNQMFVPLSQAMPALAATQDPEVLKNAAAVMQFILERSIELSGSNRSTELRSLLTTGKSDPSTQVAAEVEQQIGVMAAAVDGMASIAATTRALQEQIAMLTEAQGHILNRIGMGIPSTTPDPNNPQEGAVPSLAAVS